ncbi:MAG: sensor histidine kinase [Thermincolia bacterium]
MKVNIFVKILGTYVLVILLTMAVVAGLQLYLVQNHLLESKEKEVLVRSQDLADVTKPLLISGQDLHPVINFLNRADRILGTEAWVIDKTGKVLAASANHWHCEGITLEDVDLEQLIAGQVSVRRGQSQFFDEPVIRAAAPILHGGRFIGAVILYTPVAGIHETYTTMREFHLVALIFGMVMSVLLGSILSRYITKLVREVSRAAQGIADGNFADRVKVNSQDELGQLGETFNYMAQRLADYEKMRKDFVANVSHELRSPLTSIQGFIEALSEGKSKDKAEEARYLAILKKETYRLSKLVNDLLEISRFDAQGVEFDFAPFPVETVINRAMASLQPQLGEKNLEIKTLVPKNMPHCHGDEDRIEQVIHNLLENAIRYSPQGGKILISARLLDEEVLVEVADSGPGIPKEELTNIWERFYRLDQARSRDKGGTGLGLAIVHEIVKKHRGYVWVDSEEGEGAVFGFALPIAVEKVKIVGVDKR